MRSPLGLFGRQRERAAPAAPAGAGRARGAPRGPDDVARLARPAIRVHSDRDGLPMNSVVCLAFDRAGYLWVGTQDGAARYNGRRWTGVDMPDRLRSNYVVALLSSSDGALWAGTKGAGLARLGADGRWSVFDSSNSGLPQNVIRCLLETRGERGPVLWAGTSGRGLARLEDGRWSVFDTSSGLPNNVVRCLVETRGERGGQALWVATDGGGLARLEDGRWSVFDTSNSGLPDNRVRGVVESRGEDGGPVLWVGTELGVARLEGGRWTVFDASNSGMPGEGIMCMAETQGADGRRVLWAGTYGGGLGRFEGGRWSVLDASSGLPSGAIDALVARAEEPGVLWVGTNGGGLVRLDEGRWRAFDATPGAPAGCLPDNGVRCVLVTGDEEGATVGGAALWVGTEIGGLARLEGGRWTVFDTSNSALPNNTVMCLLETRDEGGDGGPPGRSLWAGTYTGGLARIEDGRWTVVDTSNSGLPNDAVFSLLETDGVFTPGGRGLWVGTSGGGLARLEDGRWTVFDTSNSGLPNDGVMALAETSGEGGRRALWIATYGGGLARLEDGRWSVFKTPSGDPAGRIPNDTVLGLHVSTDGAGRSTLWVGTAGGVAWCDPAAPTRWRTLTDSTTPALPNNVVYQICEDAHGRIYFLTNRGVARLTRRTPTREDPSELDLFTFTTDDGLPSPECNSGASSVDSRGRVWAGTIAGAAVFDPSLEVEDRRPKPLHVERTRVRYENGGARRLAPGEALRHDENSLEFEFALLSYFRESDTRYRSQLAGFEREPREWVADFRRVYTNLPAGEYAFRVSGRDWAGNVSGPVEVAFKVRPAPWRTWWAYLLYAGAAGGAVYGGVRYRLGALEARQEELEQLVAERTAAHAASEARARDQAEKLAEAVEQLKLSERAALEASRAKSVFLSSMSHELRTPLNSVLGFAELVAREDGLTPGQREGLAIITRSGEHLLGLIDDVLSLAKIEAGKLTLSERTFELPALLRGVESMMRARATIKGLRLRFELDESLPRWVRGDEGKLRQVLLNLLGNAVKFTEGGSVTLRARWEDGVAGGRAAGGDRATFEVEDTGHGIAEEEMEKLFEGFVQTAAGIGSGEGTGLGLAISREMVRLMGGDIRVRSRLAHGSVFSFDVELPLAEEARALPRRRRVTGLAPGQPVPRVLVVDDVEENRLLLGRMLLAAGIDVREAADGREAVEAWREWRPDLIWMDVRMPEMDGRAATRAIRAEESAECWVLSAESEGAESESTQHSALSTQHSCKIVALTASAFEHEREELLAGGSDDFVAKPFREETIFEMIALHLGVRFLYAAPEPEAPAAGEPVLVPERLAALPAPLLEALVGAVRIGDADAALAAAEAARDADAPLAAELARAIGNFEFDRLGALVARLRETPG